MKSIIRGGSFVTETLTNRNKNPLSNINSTRVSAEKVNENVDAPKNSVVLAASEPGKTMYFLAFYAARIMGSILSCGLNYNIVTTLVRVKCNMQVGYCSDQLVAGRMSWTERRGKWSEQNAMPRYIAEQARAYAIEWKSGIETLSIPSMSSKIWIPLLDAHDKAGGSLTFRSGLDLPDPDKNGRKRQNPRDLEPLLDTELDGSYLTRTEPP